MRGEDERVGETKMGELRVGERALLSKSLNGGLRVKQTRKGERKIKEGEENFL